MFIKCSFRTWCLVTWASSRKCLLQFSSVYEAGVARTNACCAPPFGVAATAKKLPGILCSGVYSALWNSFWMVHPWSVPSPCIKIWPVANPPAKEEEERRFVILYGHEFVSARKLGEEKEGRGEGKKRLFFKMTKQTQPSTNYGRASTISITLDSQLYQGTQKIQVYVGRWLFKMALDGTLK